MKYGLRAAFIILRRYIRRYKKTTISQIVSTWAPASENDTQRYIDVVSRMMDYPSDQPIDYADKDTMCHLVSAMAQMECGQQVDYNTILQAYDLA